MECQTGEGELQTRHKQERKDLQAKIQALKKSVSKGDKKKKKDVGEEIAKLEQEIDTRQAQELGAIKSDPIAHPEEPPADELTATETPIEPDENETAASGPVTRTTRAAKRRSKKAQDEKERQQRIAEQAEKNKDGPRNVEMNAIQENLKALGLQLFSVPADGNCLYCAINHQLGIKGKPNFTVSKLRKTTAEFMRENKDDFLPFVYNDNESDESCPEEFFEAYCKQVANTKLWGGQLELRALSTILQCPIKVIQANGPATVQGDAFIGPELILTYHRHLYRLGEHYNSTVEAAADEEDA